MQAYGRLPSHTAFSRGFTRKWARKKLLQRQSPSCTSNTVLNDQLEIVPAVDMDVETNGLIRTNEALPATVTEITADTKRRPVPPWLVRHMVARHQDTAAATEMMLAGGNICKRCPDMT